MREFDKPTGKYVPSVGRKEIITNYDYAGNIGKIYNRPAVKALHSINLKKYQDKIRKMEHCCAEEFSNILFE